MSALKFYGHNYARGIKINSNQYNMPLTISNIKCNPLDHTK